MSGVFFIESVTGLDKKEFTSDTRAGYIVLAYLAKAEMLAAREGKPQVLNNVDIKPAVTVLDNNKVHNPAVTECMRVATILKKKFGNMLKSRNHEKSSEVEKSVITHGEFRWQTDKRPNDCGVFVMRHMEDYMGMNLVRWDCGLEEEDCNLIKEKIVRAMMEFKAACVEAKKKKATTRRV
ncbi:hypothetical protein CTI12_AA600680 [Artemisia annua]|uniref:Ulp1 protease family, C-terminal catalytic domain-containing protein n=1 Tax=Artemisia annua TaxID=35608 RepID=A0A2U1KHZ1_ARTAN|nr:hypothetical protein CTI12_AA600680 [Artemisia annua]